MIEAICEAEKDAFLACCIMQQKAQETIDEAHKAGKETVSSTLKRAESEIAHLIRASDQKATKEAEELASSTANRLATMRARAERRLDSAAQLILERIVSV